MLGLGDRHGENILFDSNSGEAMHVDFNCLFNKVRLKLHIHNDLLATQLEKVSASSILCVLRQIMQIRKRHTFVEVSKAFYFVCRVSL